MCGKCKQIHYCSRHHQKIDWKYHKASCGQSGSSVTTANGQSLLIEGGHIYPEYEIVIENESDIDQENAFSNEELLQQISSSTEINLSKKKGECGSTAVWEDAGNIF